MTCGEVRECLFAFLDDELDRASSIAVQRHLEHCSACAREAEIERAIGDRLAQALEPAEEPPAVDERRMKGALVHGEGPRSKRLALFGLGALLMAALLAGGWWHWRAGSDFPSLLVADLRHLVEEGAHLEMSSSSPERIASWIERTRGWSVHVPTPRDDAGHLIGARECRVAGRDAILLLYELRGALASLVVLPTERMDLDDMRPGDAPGRFADRCRGHPVIAQRRGDLTYIATGPCPRKRLLELLPRPTERSAAVPEPPSDSSPAFPRRRRSHEWNRSAS